MPPSIILTDKIRALLSDEPGLSERKMFGGLCFMVNGNMACGITAKDELMLRVGLDAYEAALQQDEARVMDFTGRPMKGMIFIDPKNCTDSEALHAWLERGLSFARSLPPK